MPRDSEDILDALLVLRAQSGEREAVSELARRWHSRLMSHARVLIGRESDAADAVQEAWMAAIRGLPRLRDPESFAPWMFRTLRNKCVEHIRRLQSQRKNDSVGTTPRAEALYPRHDDTVSDADRVRRAIGQLAEGDRELISLHYGAGLSMDQIADALWMPQGTVKTRLYRARQELKTILEREHHGQH